MHMYGIHMKFRTLVVSAVMPRRNLPVSNTIAYYRALVYRWEIPLWVSKRCETDLISMPCSQKNSLLSFISFHYQKKRVLIQSIISKLPAFSGTYLAHISWLAQDSIIFHPFVAFQPSSRTPGTVLPYDHVQGFQGSQGGDRAHEEGQQNHQHRETQQPLEKSRFCGAKSWKAIWG